MRVAHRPVLTRLGSLLWTSPRSSCGSRALELGLAGAGLAGGFAAFTPMVGALGVILLAALGVVVLVGASQDREGALASVLRGASRVAVVIILGFLGYETLAFGAMLSWAVPWWALVGTGVLLAASVATHVRPPGAAPRVALLVPMGAWVGACLWGWSEEIGVARCADYLQAAAQPDVEVVAPSTAALRSCEAGERLRPAGHPRKLFEGARPGELFATIQRSGQSVERTSTFSGGLCAVTLPELGGGVADVSCRDDLPGLYGLAFDRETLLVGGSFGLQRLSAEAPFETLGQSAAVHYVSTLLLVPGADPGEVLAFYDDMDRVDRFALPSLRRLESRPLPIAPEEVRYDAQRREGVYCAASTPLFAIEGRPYLALAMGSDLLQVRLLGENAPWAWLAFSDGCDVDLDARRVYVGVGTLGILAVLDYDSGEVVEVQPIGFGVRPLLHDPERGVLYAGSYLDGWVRELDVRSGEQLRRWFVGRFVRHIVRDPGTDALLVTSTLGVVRIRRS
jgi:hypothetical protein